MSGSETLRATRLTIVGDGPFRPRLEELAREYGLSDRVEFTGWLEHGEVSSWLRKSQVFVSPSLREFGGGVVLEAMASALPAIVVDYGGPGELITPETAIGLPMAPRGTLVPALRQAMESLVNDHDRCRRMGHAGSRRVWEEITWEDKAEKIVAIYHEMLERAAEWPARTNVTRCHIRPST